MLNYAQNMLKIYSKYAQNMLKICSKYAQNMLKFFYHGKLTHYVQTIYDGN